MNRLIRTMIIVVSTGLTFIGLVVIAVVLPTVHDIIDHQKLIQQRYADVEERYQRAQQIRTTLKNYETIRTYEQQITSLFITHENQIAFIDTLELLAKQKNLQLTVNADLSVTDTKTTYTKIPVVLNIKGATSDIIAFVRDIEVSLIYIEVQAVALASDDPENSTWDTSNASISGHVYRLNQVN